MSLSPWLITAYIIGLFVLFILCRIFIKPLKWLLRLCISCIFGCIAMSVVNYMFSKYGICFEINPLTAMLSGVLGVPGMIITFILGGIL